MKRLEELRGHLVVVTVVLTGCHASANGNDLSEPGPYEPGVTNVTVTRPGGGTFSALLYYPATAPGTDAPYDGSGAPYPALSFGHGFVTAPTRYVGTLEHLATWGYLVMATQSGLELFPNHAEYAEDMSACLTFLESASADSSSPWFGQIDVGRFGMFGHSMGGGAAILATANDARVGALATLAANETNPSAVAVMQNITVPVYLLTGDEDGITNWEQNSQVMYDAANPPKQLPLILGGCHCGFLDDRIPLFCDSGSLPDADQLAITRQRLTAYFNLYLKEYQSAWSIVWGPQRSADPRVDGSRLDPGIVWAPSSVEMTAYAGAATCASFVVTNSGIATTTYDVLFEGNVWPVTVEPSQTGELDPGGNAAVELCVAVPGDGVANTDTVLLIARSELDGGTRGYATVTVNRLERGDCDANGVVDSLDVGPFADCISGPIGDAADCCDCADFDTDGKADLHDFAAFQEVFVGS